MLFNYIAMAFILDEVDMNNPNNSAVNSQEGSKSPAGFEIKRMPSGHFVLKVWGRLPPTWIGNLSSGLSRNHISVISGSAKKIRTTWHAEFEIMATRPVVDPDKIDYLELARSDPDKNLPVTLSLDEFVLDDDSLKNDGALRLEVKAGDQLGFLGALLNRLAFLSLFPESMSIETVNDRIFDRFLIKGVGGQFPSSASVKALRQRLESFLVDRQGKA